MDALRAIKLIHTSMERTISTEDGKFDFDQFGTEFSKKDRDKVKGNKDMVVNIITSEYPFGLTIEEIHQKLPELSLKAIENIIDDLTKTTPQKVYIGPDKKVRLV